jgi:hypothetical protein
MSYSINHWDFTDIPEKYTDASFSLKSKPNMQPQPTSRKQSLLFNPEEGGCIFL